MHWSGGTFEPETFEVSEIQEPTARFACRQTIGKAVFTKAKPHHRITAALAECLRSESRSSSCAQRCQRSFVRQVASN